MKYVWTKTAQERAEELCLEPRIEGTEATVGGDPIDGPIAIAWIGRGLIREVEKIESNTQKNNL